MSLCPCSLATSWNGSRQPEAGVDPALGFSLHPGWCVSGRTPRLHWQSRGSAAAFPFCQPGLSSLLSCPRRTRDHSCGEWAEGMEGRCCGCPSRLLGGLPRAPAPCVMGTGFHLPCTVELAHGGVDHVTPSSGLGLPRSASARVPSEATAQTETSFWKRYSSASAPGVCPAPVTGTCQTPHLDLWGYLANGQSSTEVLHDKCHQHRTRLFSPLQAIPGCWCSHGTTIPGKSALLKNSAPSHMMLCPLGRTPLEAPKYLLIKIAQMPPPILSLCGCLLNQTL